MRHVFDALRNIDQVSLTGKDLFGKRGKLHLPVKNESEAVVNFSAFGFKMMRIVKGCALNGKRGYAKLLLKLVPFVHACSPDIFVFFSIHAEGHVVKSVVKNNYEKNLAGEAICGIRQQTAE